MKRRLALPMTGAAIVAATMVVGSTPTMSTAPALTAAAVDYIRGTNIGWTPTDEQYRAFVGQVLEGTGIPADPPTSTGNVAYNAGFWPVSHNYIFDLTWNESVAQGVTSLDQRAPQGDVIFGMSQGAVVASRYKAEHPEGTGNTFVLVENPSRPNGGVMARFAGLYIPVLNVTFSGATPENGDATVDVARQYDGWADFPTYPLNLLATANAVLGLLYIHGQTQTELSAADIEAAKAGGSMYYQQHGDTTYYLIRTDRLPLLMPLTGIVPDPILKAVDPVLRTLVEMGYDRTDYSVPTPAKLFPSPGSVTAAAGQQPAAVSAPTQANRITAGPAPRPQPASTSLLSAPVASAPKTGTPKRIQDGNDTPARRAASARPERARPAAAGR